MMRNRTEKGAVDLMIIAVALPVLIFLFAVALDFARIPATQQYVESILNDTIYRLTPDWNCSSGECSHVFGVEPHIPYAHNFCFLSRVDSWSIEESDAGTRCVPDISRGDRNVHAFLYDRIPLALMDKAVRSFTEKLKSGILFWTFNVDSTDIKVEFGIARMSVPLNGTSQTFECPYNGWTSSGGTLSSTMLASLGSSALNPSVCHSLDSDLRGSGVSQLGWMVQGCGLDDSSVSSSRCRSLWLSSYWIVGVVNVKLTSFIGGLAWPGEAFGQNDYIVKSYAIVPLTSVAGIQ